MDNSNTKQKLIIQIVCLLLSIGLWFYVTNIENPLRTITLNKVPVKLVNIDSLVGSNLVLLPNQELYVSLRVEGLTQEIRKIDKADFEIQVDLSEYALKSGLNKIFVNIVDYPSNVTVKNSNNLFVNIYTEDLVQKEMGITSAIKIETNSSQYIEEPVFSPAKVQISGPESMVSRIDKVVAVGNEENLTETISKSYEIQPIDANGEIVEGVTLSESTVETTIKVSKGIIVPLKINTVGNIKSELKLLGMKLSQEQVEIVGPMEKIQEITEINIKAIDLASIKEDTSIEVDLNIPEGVQVNLGQEPLTLKIDVDKITTRDFEIPFEIVGLKEGFNFTPKNEKVNVKVSGFESDILKLNENDFKAILDISSNNEVGSFSEAPKITLNNVEQDITLESVEKISYEIIKKEDTE